MNFVKGIGDFIRNFDVESLVQEKLKKQKILKKIKKEKRELTGIQLGQYILDNKQMDKKYQENPTRG